MSNIYYLHHTKTQSDKTPSRTNKTNEIEKLVVAISPPQFAALLINETVTGNGLISQKVSDQLEKLSKSNFKKQNPNQSGPQSMSAIEAKISSIQRSTQKPIANPYAGIDNIIAAKIDAIQLKGIRNGKVQFKKNNEIDINAKSPASIQIQANYIAVPDTILIARQKSSGCLTFCFNSLSELEVVVSDIFKQNKMMIESWATQRVNLPFKLQYQAQNSFGRISHAGSDSASDLRSIAVSLSKERLSQSHFFILEISLKI